MHYIFEIFQAPPNKSCMRTFLPAWYSGWGAISVAAHLSCPQALEACLFILVRYTGYPQGPPKLGVSQDYVGSMLLVSQLKLPSHSYRAIRGVAATVSQIAA